MCHHVIPKQEIDSMKNFIKQNLALVTGVALPVLIVGFFLLASTLPRFFVTAPMYDFLFTDQKYDYDEKDDLEIRFTIKDGRLHAAVKEDKNAWHDRLYRYEHKSKSIREIEVVIRDDMSDGDNIMIPETTRLKMSSNKASPDGYEFSVDRRYGGGLIGELFYSPRRNSIILSKNGRRVLIPTPNNAYLNNAKFLCWIIEQGNGNRQ